MTIKEFAQHLGVSTATISRAFTPGASILPETRATILEQARTLGYAPNPSARNLARKRSRLIGLDFPANADVLADAYLMELARGVQTAVQAADYGLLLNTLPRPGGDLELLREWVFGKAVDGVVIVVPADFSLDALCPLAGRDVPCVLIKPGAQAPDFPLPTVTLDTTEGAHAALLHLRRLGHKRIGFLTSVPDDDVHRVYRDVLQSDALYRPELILETASTIADGRAAMHRLLASPTSPTAVFCRTDILALGALRAIRDMGLRVPEDIALIGHDDIVLAELSDPALTTVRIDTERIGQVATRMLLSALPDPATVEGDAPLPALSHPLTASLHETVRTELIVRRSTGRVPRTTFSLP